MFRKEGKKTPRRSAQIEYFLTEMLEQLSPSNPRITISAPGPRAKWLAQRATGVINRNVRESLLFCEPDDPLYGNGTYKNIVAHAGEDELILEWVDPPPFNLNHLFVEVIATERDTLLYPTANEDLYSLYKTVARTLATMRQREKYVELQGPLYRLSVSRQDNAILISYIRPTAQPKSPLTGG